MAKRGSSGFTPLVLIGVVGALLLTFMDRKATAATLPDPGPGPTPRPPPKASPIGQRVGGVIPGATYEIIAAPPAGIRAVLLRVVAYPRDPSVVGKTFALSRTIDKWGPGHPTVQQVAALL